ncbi:Hypothetical Protein OBI_RACECAR_50 [Arthrobacter phage Racecar]|nr:hypothetical protein PBI_RACECAR_132 [Arthrobacter phage Racecar]
MTAQDHQEKEKMPVLLQSATPQPRHREENTLTETPIFEQIVADTGFRPARRFVGSQRKGRHAADS